MLKSPKKLGILFFFNIFCDIITFDSNIVSGGIKLKRLIFVLSAFLFVIGGAGAAEMSLNDAMNVVRANCAGISDELADIKKMAGVGTAVSAAGTAVAGGAVGTGVAKARIDKMSGLMGDLIKKYKEMKSNPEPVIVSDIASLTAQLTQMVRDRDLVNNLKSKENQILADDELAKMQAEKDALDKKSKTMGNVRTGLMAASSASSIAGAVIAGSNKVKPDLMARIGACMGAVEKLAQVKIQVRLDNSASDMELQTADKIIAACGQYDLSDVEKISNRAHNAMVASSVGAASGVVGTVTSGMANTDKVRNSQDEQREKNLNMASNVLAGVTTAASLTSTVFNATQISAAKRVIETASQCEEAIK